MLLIDIMKVNMKYDKALVKLDEDSTLCAFHFVAFVGNIEERRCLFPLSAFALGTLKAEYDSKKQHFHEW